MVFRTSGLLVLIACLFPLSAAVPLEQGFRNPPPEARLRCYWWWLNGNVTKKAITRDLEQMKAKGFGGAIVVDAGGAEQRGNNEVPAGALFGSPAWRELFRHAVVEGDRLGLELSLNILSGWNLGGPMVKPEESAKLVTWSRTVVSGPAHFDQALPLPKIREGFYRDIAVLAYPLRHGPGLAGEAGSARRPIRALDFKGAFKEVGFSTPDTRPLLGDVPGEPGEQDAQSSQVIELTARDGRVQWDVPAGAWEILRFGYTSSGSRVSTSSGAWQGLVIDYLDHTALESYFRQVVDPILADVRPYLGRTLKYLVTDSWELDGVNWTPRFREEFRKRRGYDPVPFAPVLAGRILDDRLASNRFLNDLRRTVGDLVADEHYSTFAKLAQSYGLGIHPESGGPHGAPLDALKCLGRGTFPQMEFWAKSATHRVKDEDRFFVKEAASAAHIYGQRFVAAEGLTSIGPHWQESIWSNLKPTFDRALCEGLNLLVWHTFTSSPEEMGLPGQEYFAGTHFNPNITWWEQSGAFLSYINRSQFLLQQGRFVADVLYYYGDHVPNFVQLKRADPAKVLPGYDYDVVDEEVLAGRLRVENGRLALPDGMNYRVLVLPDLPEISLAALRKVRELAAAGATVIGRRPERTTGLEKFPSGDEEVRRLSEEIWGACDGKTVLERRYGKGRIVCGGTARETLLAGGVPPDFESATPRPPGAVDYIHRSYEGAEIYFVSNQREVADSVPAVFRMAGKAPELWDPETGDIRQPGVYDFTSDGRTRLTLSLKPYGSVFVVFRKPAGKRTASLTPVVPQVLAPPVTVSGPWAVSFSGPLAVPPPRQFDELRSWTEHADPLVKYFSGSATYTTDIDIPTAMLGPGKVLELDLGEVREIAETRLNGQDLGIQWTSPFLVDVTKAAKPGRNRLEVRVTNLWANRLIGDTQLPPERGVTRTNITRLTKDTPLLPSGLLGPVTLRSVALATAP